MFKKLYSHLKSCGYAVYSIGQHTGHCTEPYIVIKERGESPFLTGLAASYVDILVFYPLGSYSKLETFVSELRAALKELRQMRYTHTMSSVTIDNLVRAYSVGLTYQIIHKRSD